MRDTLPEATLRFIDPIRVNELSEKRQRLKSKSLEAGEGEIAKVAKQLKEAYYPQFELKSLSRLTRRDGRSSKEVSLCVKVPASTAVLQCVPPVISSKAWYTQVKARQLRREYGHGGKIHKPHYTCINWDLDLALLIWLYAWTRRHLSKKCIIERAERLTRIPHNTTGSVITDQCLGLEQLSIFGGVYEPQSSHYTPVMKLSQK